MSAVQNPVHIVTRRITTQDNMITIDYPAVKDMESPTVQHRINRSIIALVLFFQLYEITPYYMGLQYFTISVYQIQDIIDQEGPLGIMAAGD